MEVSSLSGESTYNIKVFTTRPTSFQELVSEKKVSIPSSVSKELLPIDLETSQILGDVFQTLMSTSENNEIDLNTQMGIEYLDNVKLLIDFMKMIHNEFSSEEIKELSELFTKYHQIGNTPISKKLLQRAFQFAKNNGLFPTKRNPMNLKTFQVFYDIGFLAEFLELPLAIMASSFWFKLLFSGINPLQIGDIMDMPMPTSKDNLIQLKKAIYYLKYPDQITEATSGQLENINVELQPGIDIDYQIDTFKTNFLIAQNDRLRQFYQHLNETIPQYEINFDAIMKKAAETDYLNADDIRRLQHENNKSRFLKFHEEVKAVKETLKRNLMTEEIRQLAIKSNNLSEKDKKIDLQTRYEFYTQDSQ